MGVVAMNYNLLKVRMPTKMMIMMIVTMMMIELMIMMVVIMKMTIWNDGNDIHDHDQCHHYDHDNEQCIAMVRRRF